MTTRRLRPLRGTHGSWGRLAGAAAVLAVSLAGCGTEPPGPDRLVLEPKNFAALPGWANGAQAGALGALVKSCAVFAKRPDDRPVGPDGIGGRIGDWREACAEATRLAAKGGVENPAARQFFERYFSPYLATNRGEETGLFTGYFEIELNGARTRSARYSVPLYRRPPELVTVHLGRFRDELKGRRIAGQVENGVLVPFASRRDIAGGVLHGRGLELVWVDDAADAFFLHVQGSGRVRLADGGVMRVGYAASNGHAYRSIGRALIERGALARADVSMQSIRAWMRAKPSEATALMHENAAYVFFRELSGEGPVGAQGVALTAERSLAVDRKFMPLGVPIWLDTTAPLAPDRPLRRLMIAQDTGGAITGPVRGDVFWGFGELAASRAGQMKAMGRYFLLLPRAARPGQRASR